LKHGHRARGVVFDQEIHVAVRPGVVADARAEQFHPAKSACPADTLQFPAVIVQHGCSSLFQEAGRRQKNADEPNKLARAFQGVFRLATVHFAQFNIVVSQAHSKKAMNRCRHIGWKDALLDVFEIE
jgi:hypothetical protein